MLRPLLSALADAVLVLVFAAVGRSAHSHGTGVLGVMSTAWPFLAGAAIGWAVARAWRSPLQLWPTAAVVLASTWGGGMILRWVTGGGIAPAFLLVAAIVLTVMLMGWRLVVQLALRPRALYQD